jgi:uncharacterized protein (DUF302 family)
MVNKGVLGFRAVVKAPLAQAIERTKEALKAEGFGVLTTIDVQETMKQKLGVDVDPYVILGACSPTLAHRALQAEPSLGLLLPCNVTVREIDGQTEVMAVDPEMMLHVAGTDPALSAVAAEAAGRLRRAMRSLDAGVA